VASLREQIINYPFVPERVLDVDPIYRQLQQNGPIKVRLPFGEPCWLATRYEDVKLVHHDRRFSKALGLTRDIPRLREGGAPKDPNMLASMDPPRHTRLRRLAMGSFSPPKIRRMREWIEGMVDELIDEMVASGQPADFFSCVSRSLPNLVMTGILGVPRADVPAFRTWIDSMLAVNSTAEQRVDAQICLRAYVLELVAERRRQSTDDVLGALVEARDQGDQLSEDELVMMCLNLFLGGFETTVAQLGSSMFLLMERRHLWQDVVNDPQLLPAALEELWRWIPSHRYGTPLVRWAREDVDLSGDVTIGAGDPILPERGAANRDESVFPHGWELDFHRQNPKPHLALGFGPHHCLGAPLAQMEIEVTLAKMISRFPKVQLAIPAGDVRWSNTSFMRCVEELPLTW
jgi:cytochrome P450 RapN